MFGTVLGVIDILVNKKNKTLFFSLVFLCVMDVGLHMGQVRSRWPISKPLQMVKPYRLLMQTQYYNFNKRGTVVKWVYIHLNARMCVYLDFQCPALLFSHLGKVKIIPLSSFS